MAENKAGKWPRYDQYRQAEADWLGKIPSHWQTVPLKHLTRTIEQGWSPQCDGLPVGSEDEWGVLKVGCVNGGVFRPEENKRLPVDLPPVPELAIQQGDVLISRANTRELVGSVAVAAKDYPNLLLCDKLYRLRMDTRRCLPEFIAAFLSTAHARSQIELKASGASASMLNISQGTIRNLLVPLPDTGEQAAIIRHVDRETGAIDRLIAKQERLTELMVNKRQAIISKAVRKGLNAGVPMKETDTSWLGVIPAHWSYGKTRYFARLESGHTPSRNVPEYWENCTIPWFSLGDVWQIRQGNVDVVTATKERISKLGMANSAARLLPAGTVMLSRTASVGFAAIMGVPMATTQDFANWTCGPKLRPHYLLNVFRAMRPEFDRLMVGSTHQTIYMPDIIAMSCPLPPVEEQDAIVAFIKEETAKIDALIAKCRRTIDLLREHRASLISAVVTGKIRVTEDAQQPEELAAA